MLSCLIISMPVCSKLLINDHSILWSGKNQDQEFSHHTLSQDPHHIRYHCSFLAACSCITAIYAFIWMLRQVAVLNVKWLWLVLGMRAAWWWQVFFFLGRFHLEQFSHQLALDFWAMDLGPSFNCYLVPAFRLSCSFTASLSHYSASR